MRVLIVGNIIKDVYLELDEKQGTFETDDHGTPWLDLAFDGGTHNYSRRTSIYAGAAVALEILNKFNIDTAISGRDTKLDPTGRVIEFSDGRPSEVYRYILTHGQHIAYVSPTVRTQTKLATPTDQIEWIFIDRSANISDETVSDINKYFEISPSTKLAVFATTRGCGGAADIDLRNNGGTAHGTRVISKAYRDLINRADIAFVDGGLFDLNPAGDICEISENRLKFRGKSQTYFIKNADYITHLTSYSIIAATIFAATLKGYSTEDALLLAALNVENSKNTGTLTESNLKTRLAEAQTARSDLRLIAKTLVSHPRGILAADESGGSIHKKFEAADIPDDPEHRRDYRNIFIGTSDLEKYVNGVILFEETAYQLADNGEDFASYLVSRGIIPGIKVDQGLEPFTEPGHETEKWTKGLEGLPSRLVRFHEIGARFAKWRAAFEITFRPGDTTPRTPSKLAITKNAEILARYAKDCQDANIVPIVEPEVVHDGNYSIETCANITGEILDELFRALKNEDVDLAACILKCNMVLAGSQYENQSTPAEVGEWTARVLREHVPPELAGVVFLSGGQTIEQSTENLQAVTDNGPFDWPVTFSFARALQGPALDAWQGNNANIDAAREAFKTRLIANCDALNKKV